MKRISLLVLILFLFSSTVLLAVQQTKKKTTTKKTTTTVKKTTPTRQVVGVIGTKKIYLDEYKTMLNNYIQYWQNKGEKITPDSKKTYNNRLWEELVAKEAYNKDIKSRRLTVTKAELDARTLSNPPDQVKNIPQLQKNGKFDTDMYNMAIQKDSVFKKNVQAVIMDTYPYEKLFNTIKAQVKIKPDSVKNDWMLKNDKASAKIITFDWHTMKNVTVSDSEMMAYYQKNIETYKRNPARILNYIKVTFDPSSADSLAAKAKADSIYNQLVAGANFADMAKKFSQDPGSGANGGDLGYFGHGRMVAEFDKAAFETEVGKFSKPFTTRFGWHIVMTTDKRKDAQGQDEVKASHILIKFEASPQTKQDRKNEASQIFEQAKAVGLKKAIEKTHYIMLTSEEFYADAKYINGIGNDEALVKDAFSKGKGALLEMTTNPNGEMIIAEVADTLGVHYLTFDSQKGNIQNTIEKDKSIAKAKVMAENFFKTYGPDKYLEQAQKDSLMIIDANDITANAGIQRIGNVPALSEAIFKANVNTYTPLISNDRGDWIAYVTKRDKPDLKDWEKQKTSLLKQARDSAEQMRLSQWYMGIKKNITVVDNRKKFFDL